MTTNEFWAHSKGQCSLSAIFLRGVLPELLNRAHVMSCRFATQLGKGLPFVVTGVATDRGMWQPEYLSTLIKGEGTEDADRQTEDALLITDCQTGEEQGMTPGDFFARYMSADPSRMVKLKDWPKHGSFKELLPEHYQVGLSVKIPPSCLALTCCGPRASVDPGRASLRGHESSLRITCHGAHDPVSSGSVEVITVQVPLKCC
jgi:hypothetical protein